MQAKLETKSAKQKVKKSPKKLAVPGAQLRCFMEFLVDVIAMILLSTNVFASPALRELSLST